MRIVIRLHFSGKKEAKSHNSAFESLTKATFLFQDRVPADGIVRAGRSTIDESSFTGEPLPVTKLPGVIILLLLTNSSPTRMSETIIIGQ